MSKKEMLADLKRSGLTPADATKLKMKPLTKQQTKSLVKKELLSYEIPYFDINGKPTGFKRVRLLEKERKFGKEVDTIKYSQPEDSGVHLYMPPLIDWKVITTDIEYPIVFTEGEKKAAKACKEGLPCIGLGGVWSFRSKKQNKLLIDDFDNFIWKGREVYLIFDSDLKTNTKVMQALIAFSKELSDIGAYVNLGYLPEEGKGKVGLDDYLLTHTVDDLLELEYEEFSRSYALWELNDELAVIEELGSIIVLKTGKIYNKSTITELLYADRKYSYVNQDEKLVVTNAAKEWVQWPNRRSHRKLEYAPGKPEVLPDNSLNTWKGWGCKPKKGSVAPFIKLLNHLIPDEDFREWLMKWLAYPIQYPGTKLYSSVLLHGLEHGTGKSFIGYIMKRIYGKNSNEITQEDIHGNYNDWTLNRQFVMGEEITGSEKRKDSDKLKHMITREEINVKIKYVAGYEVSDCTNFFFTSNHPDAFFLEDRDRRHAIYEVTCSPLPDEFYTELDSWKNGEGPSYLFYYLLNEVDCTGFNPKAKAFETESKKEMIRLSKSDIDTFAFSLREDPDHILIYDGVKIDRDLFTVQEIVDIYDPDHRLKTTQIAMSKALKRAGFRQLPTTQTLSGSKRLWALRNTDKWMKSLHHERVANYDKSVIMLDKARKKYKQKANEKT